jgi:hypothetical protein
VVAKLSPASLATMVVKRPKAHAAASDDRQHEGGLKWQFRLLDADFFDGFFDLSRTVGV